MRLRRRERALFEQLEARDASREPVDDEPLALVDRGAVLGLIGDARALGFVVLPAVAFASITGRLERTEALLAAQAERQRNLVDGTELIAELGHLAGEVLPETAAELIDQRRQNLRLELQNMRLERDVSTIASALVADEFPEIND